MDESRMRRLPKEQLTEQLTDRPCCFKKALVLSS